MRIRRKKHLEERKKYVEKILLTADYDIKNSLEAVKNKRFFNFKELFGNDNEVNLEIGCGKGLFICETAKINQNENFFAVELLDNIIIMACERCLEYNLNNVKFFNCGADYLPRYISNGSIKKIYLNFSPPYPGDRYENRRLTCDRLMEYYVEMLKRKGEIELKTDDKKFFDYSFNQALKFGFTCSDLTEQTKKELFNVKTEYELKFNKLNIPIYKFIAKK